MTDDYLKYLQSPEWKAKRNQRISIGKQRCSACFTTKNLDVHHLTYARIYHEDMADLLPLCRSCHDLAEEFIKDKKLSRSENPLWLATETVRLILQHLNPSKKQRIKNSKIRNKSHYRK